MRAVSTPSVLLGTTILVGIAVAWPFAAHPTARAETGIREVIPSRDQARYQIWKDEFLSTETGRREWQAYSQDPRLLLTIATSMDNRYGAGIGRYEWNRAGQLTAATITLGARLDQEYPEPVYYPVLNALKHSELPNVLGRSVLAAAKMAHEFGHLRRMISTDAEVYRLQTELVPSYNAIIRNNGRNTRDPRLQDLVRRMGGTPMEIWEDREYWGETNAMLYLRDRIPGGELQCSLFSSILRNVDTYAGKAYRSRFAEIAESPAARSHCDK
jgi:hypothetical protein